MINSHSLLRKPTVKGLPCGDFAVCACWNTQFEVFPRLNAQYRFAVCTMVISSSPVRGAKKKDRFRTVFFLSNPKDWHVISPAGEYVIAEGVWHHASACILLRIDYMHHSVMIPYKALPWFHTADKLRISYTPIGVILRVAFLYYEHIMGQQFCTLTQKSLIFKGFFVFLGIKIPLFHHCTFSPTFWTWTCDLMRIYWNNRTSVI